MKNRVFLSFFTFLLLLSPFGCLSKTFVSPDTPLDERALIQGSGFFIFYGVVIDAIDGLSLDFSNSAHIYPGEHRLRLSYYMGGAPNCTDFIYFSANSGREYIVKAQVEDLWTQSPTRCFFWIEDMKTGEVVGANSPRR